MSVNKKEKNVFGVFDILIFGIMYPIFILLVSCYAGIGYFISLGDIYGSFIFSSVITLVFTLVFILILVEYIKLRHLEYFYELSIREDLEKIIQKKGKLIMTSIYKK